LGENRLRRALRVAAGLLLVLESSHATTNFSSTGGVELMEAQAVESTRISGDTVNPFQIEQDATGDADLLLFISWPIRGESGPDLPGNALAVGATAPTPYTTDTYDSESSETIAVAEDMEFVTYFLPRDS
jgi:hypothetical protein